LTAASSHRSPCHGSHSCPSDHHSYPYDGGLYCTSYADERLASDTRTVVYDGRTYWCGSRPSGPLMGAPAEKTEGSGSSGCGVERWTVKTLQDKPTLRPARATTVHYLVTRPAPAALPDSRLPFEHNVFTVDAAVTLVRGEADGDLHLVLRSGGDHMIAEVPKATCDPKAELRYRSSMALARELVHLCARARITGVAFFDFKHGQTGVAPNAIELHPILGFHCLSRF
jgi:hypothetical protein